MPWPLAGLNQSLHLCSLGENFMGREKENWCEREREERVMGKKSTICAAIRSFIHVKWRWVSDTSHGKLQWQDPTRAIQRLPVTALSVPSHDKSDTDSLLTQWGVERIDAGCAVTIYLTPNSCNIDLRYIWRQWQDFLRLDGQSIRFEKGRSCRGFFRFIPWEQKGSVGIGRH